MALFHSVTNFWKFYFPCLSCPHLDKPNERKVLPTAETESQILSFVTLEVSLEYKITHY